MNDLSSSIRPWNDAQLWPGRRTGKRRRESEAKDGDDSISGGSRAAVPFRRLWDEAPVLEPVPQ